MAIAPEGSKAIKQLIELGVIPAECRNFTLNMCVNKAITAEYEVFVSEENMQKLADVMKDNPEEAAAFLKRAIVRSCSGITEPITVEYEDELQATIGRVIWPIVPSKPKPK